MAVTYVGVTSGNSAAGTSTSFATSLPAGWAAGDVAILTGHVRGTSLTMSTPAGWTLVPGPTWPVAQGSNSRAYAWYRVLQAGDTAPTITLSGAMTGGWSMTAYRGGNTSSPIGQVGTAVVSGTSVTLPTLTGVLAGSALAVAVHAGVSTGTIPTDITADAAYTEVADHATSRATTAANQRMEAAYRIAGSAGSYGGESFGTTVTASMIAVMVEVAAAPTATTVSKSTATTWSVASTIAAAVATSWAVNAQTTAAAGTSWSVASQVSAPTATEWDVLSPVSASTATSWSTSQAVAAETASRWDTAAQVTAPTATGWEVRSVVDTSCPTRWDTAAVVTVDQSTGWAIAAAAMPPPTRGTVHVPPASPVRVPTASTVRTPPRSEVRLP